MAFIGLTMLLVPLGVVARGFIPRDDVLRHTAFAVIHKTWPQVIVGDPAALFDQSPGWHALLRAVHGLTGCGQETLATLSIAGLLFLFLVSGLLLARRWESWAGALGLWFLADPYLALRFALGRPFILTSITLMVLLAGAREGGAPAWGNRRHGLWLGLAALCTLLHGSWYLLAMVPGALLLTGRCRAASRMGVTLAAGVLLGASCTGNPSGFLGGEVRHLLRALGQGHGTGLVVDELTPGRQTVWPTAAALVVGAAAAWRRKSGKLFQEPALALGLLAWVLGYFRIWRFYLDIGFPALAVWTAWGLDELLEGVRRRWLAALLAGGVLAFAMLPDRHGRWSVDGTRGALDARVPAQAVLLPDPGGVLYANTMDVFYQTFFVNPGGDWRYVLAYEPGLMLPEDRAVVDGLIQGRPTAPVLAPWLARMTPKDRLFLDAWRGAPPSLPGILWQRAGLLRWSGRLDPARSI
jgi:hypothetical protein